MWVTVYKQVNLIRQAILAFHTPPPPMEIAVKRTITVTPAAETPRTTLWISNVDATMPLNYHTLTLYFYRCNGATNFFDIDTVEVALSRALVQFYPVAGRLKKDNENRIEIECNGKGAVLVEAEADAEMDELGDFAPTAKVGLIPVVDYSQGISSYPIFLAQVTRFKCGGVCLGIATEHHVTDGISAIHFINTWSDIARGVDIVVPPFTDRTVLRARDPPHVDFEHTEFQPPPLIKSSSPDFAGVIPKIKFSTFKLSREQLQTLKGKCHNSSTTVRYSTYEVLAAHAWRCVGKARDLPEDQDSKLFVPVDGRFRLRPPLPLGYLGNVVFTAAPTASYGELRSSPLEDLVGKIHDSLVRMDDDYLRSALDYLELQSDIDKHARGASPFKCPNLGVISWSRMPIYEADFGWGRPEYVGIGSIPSEGKSIVLPTAENDGSVLYAISLPEEQMEVFANIFIEI